MADEVRDLAKHSMSFADMIVKYRDKLTKLATGQVPTLLSAAADSKMPREDAQLMKEYLFALAQASTLPARMDPAIEKALNAIGGKFEASDVAKLVLAARAAGLDHPDEKGLRLVDRNLTFEEARRCRWSGTLVEARRGSGLEELDFKKFFVIYVPNEDLGFRSSFDIKIVDRRVQLGRA